MTISDEVGVGKPDARIFTHAVKAAGCEKIDPSEIPMIGDNLHADIGGGHSLGYATIWFDRDVRHADFPGQRVTCLTQIQKLISDG